MIAHKVYDSYQEVCNAPAETCFESYAQFRQQVVEAGGDFTIDDLARLVTPATELGERARVASEAVRQATAVDTAAPYFRGSGVIIVGTDDGVIHSVDYMASLDGDPVAEAYGNYQPVAFTKVGLAIAVAHSGLVTGECVAKEYAVIEDRLQDAGVFVPGGHHLGYAARTVSNHGVVAVGASGILPSAHTDQAMREAYPEIVMRDQGWRFTWSGDAFAGFDDLVAAETVADTITSLPHRAIGMHVVNLAVEDFPSANLH